MTTDPGDLVLDPTCGSGTTAYVAEQWGRRWITIDTSRVAIALARTRLMAAKYPYYLLADSPEGAKQRMKEEGGRMNDETAVQFGASSFIPQPSSFDIKRGFVYKRVPHVTLKSIANNEEPRRDSCQVAAAIDAIRAKLNKAAKQTWEEWEIPRDVEKGVTTQIVTTRVLAIAP